MTVRGFSFEKSCIHAMGMLLIDFTSRAPGAISAIISLDVRPLSAARDLVTPARLMSGLGSVWALVASIRIRPRQSISFKAAGALTQSVARITMSHAAASCFVPALAFGPERRRDHQASQAR